MVNVPKMMSFMSQIGLLGHFGTLLVNAAPTQILSYNPEAGDGPYFQVTEEAEQFFNDINGKFAAVTAVGNIHTGKSFMLNRIIDGKSTNDASSVSGGDNSERETTVAHFKLGAGADPETRGVWADKMPGEGDMTIVFFDTEGLEALGSKDQNDRKLFAIATLLSTEVIYNCVRTVSRSEVDTLDEFIRSTQEFAGQTVSVGSEPSTSGDSSSSEEEESIQKFLNYQLPQSLTWAVQGFQHVHGMDDYPEKYIAREVYGTHSTPTSSLFPSVDVVVFPPPHQETMKLNRLDLLPVEELDPDYNSVMRAYRERMMQRAREFVKMLPASPGSSDSRPAPMTGPHMYSYIKFLTRVANTTSIHDPKAALMDYYSMQLENMASNTLGYFDKVTTSKETVSETVQPLGSLEIPVVVPLFIEQMSSVKDVAIQMWNNTLGDVSPYPELVTQMTTMLEVKLEGLMERKERSQCTALSEFCAHTSGSLGKLFSKQLAALVTNPMAPGEFMAAANARLSAWIPPLDRDFGECCSVNKERHIASLEEIVIEYSTANYDALVRRLSSDSAALCRQLEIDVQKAQPYDDQDLERKLNNIRETSRATYLSMLARYGSQEPVFRQAELEFTNALDSATVRAREEFVTICVKQAKSEMDELSDTMRQCIAKLSLPARNPEIQRHTDKCVDDMKSRFEKEIRCSRSALARRILEQSQLEGMRHRDSLLEQNMLKLLQLADTNQSLSEFTTSCNKPSARTMFKNLKKFDEVAVQKVTTALASTYAERFNSHWEFDDQERARVRQLIHKECSELVTYLVRADYKWTVTLVTSLLIGVCAWVIYVWSGLVTALYSSALMTLGSIVTYYLSSASIIISADGIILDSSPSVVLVTTAGVGLLSWVTIEVMGQEAGTFKY